MLEPVAPAPEAPPAEVLARPAEPAAVRIDRWPEHLFVAQWDDAMIGLEHGAPPNAPSLNLIAGNAALTQLRELREATSSPGPYVVSTELGVCETRATHVIQLPDDAPVHAALRGRRAYWLEPCPELPPLEPMAPALGIAGTGATVQVAEVSVEEVTGRARVRAALRRRGVRHHRPDVERLEVLRTEEPPLTLLVATSSTPCCGAAAVRVYLELQSRRPVPLEQPWARSQYALRVVRVRGETRLIVSDYLRAYVGRVTPEAIETLAYGNLTFMDCGGC